MKQNNTKNINSNIITYTEEKERYAKSQQDATKYRRFNYERNN